MARRKELLNSIKPENMLWSIHEKKVSLDNMTWYQCKVAFEILKDKPGQLIEGYHSWIWCEKIKDRMKAIYDPSKKPKEMLSKIREKMIMVKTSALFDALADNNSNSKKCVSIKNIEVKS